MLEDKPLVVGDAIVELGSVYRVYKVGKKVTFNNENLEHIFYKPVYDTPENRTLDCSIPVKNIDQARMRRPISRQKINEIMVFLSTHQTVRIEVDLNQSKEDLMQNDPHVSAQVLKRIWMELQRDDVNATTSRQSLFETALTRLSQEVALKFEITLPQAKKKLERALKRATEA
ncbi:hypothetical protein A2801_00940 [Candidatus Woesebacteria bacterium RIFCSPHIGHO2_01_FULL_41_10]|uniref:CarD-like/TRCF RNAP-interacting domain-containing protein n=1 Tax=Candidatus Woesebacteria bacterium RIFCSPHIGHO2_01_FULL_41_10 TaxID=1802500 RepID=A0A1F7YMH4_9BACT|nr:MAG: hypothetical protein A2801_00940 [Candidatus Woesebacteria bacterium RIFCSPHIGHO2_01_FULL_41_10]